MQVRCRIWKTHIYVYIIYIYHVSCQKTIQRVQSEYIFCCVVYILSVARLYDAVSIAVRCGNYIHTRNKYPKQELIHCTLTFYWHCAYLLIHFVKANIVNKMINMVTSKWARWRLKSQASWLFARPFVQGQIKENIKAPCHWPLWGTHWWPVDSLHKGPVTRKMFPFDDVINMDDFYVALWSLPCWFMCKFA